MLYSCKLVLVYTGREPIIMTSSNPAGMGSLLKVLVVAFCIIHWVNSG